MTEQEINAAVNAAIDAWIQAHFSEDQQVDSLLTLADAGTLSDEDLLYLVQGTGSSRDRKLSLAALRDFLQTITGTISVVGQNGTTTITNLLMKIATGTDEVEVKPTYIKFISHPTESSTQELLTITKNSITIPTSAGTITISEGAVSISKTEDEVTKTTTVNKDGVTVTDGSNTAHIAKNSVSVVNGTKSVSVGKSSVQIEDSETGENTTLTDKSISTRQVIRNYNGTYSGSFGSDALNASSIVSTLPGVCCAMVVNNIASNFPKFFLDHTPAVGYEVVVDYQNINLVNTLEVWSGSSSSGGGSICMQAPNTVRRYVYKGSTTGWECLY